MNGGTVKRLRRALVSGASTKELGARGVGDPVGVALSAFRRLKARYGQRAGSVKRIKGSAPPRRSAAQAAASAIERGRAEAQERWLILDRHPGLDSKTMIQNLRRAARRLEEGRA